jgi:hypothetical protein
MPRRHEATAASSFGGRGAARVDVETVDGDEVGGTRGDGARFVRVDAVELVGVDEAGGVVEVGLVVVDELELVGFDAVELDIVTGVECTSAPSPR